MLEAVTKDTRYQNTCGHGDYESAVIEGRSAIQRAVLASGNKELLHLYRRNRCLYELDSSWEGFEWINANDADRSIFSFIRKSKDGKNNMLFVINFTPVERPDYRVGVPKHKTYQLVLDSEDPKFTGKTVQAPVKKAAKGRGKAAKQSYKKLDYKAVKSECDGRPFSFAYPLAPYGVAVFKY